MHNLTSVLSVLVLCNRSKEQEDSLETLSEIQMALSITILKVISICRGSLKSSSSSNPPDSFKNLEMDLNSSKKSNSGLSSLPVEILEMIFSNLDLQQDLFQISMTNKTFYKLTSPILYKNPIINSESQLEQLMNNGSETGLNTCVQSITFLPCRSGTLIDKKFYESNEFNRFYSTLFKVLIQQRSSDDEHNLPEMPHRLFFSIISKFPRLKLISENQIGTSIDTKPLIQRTNFTDLEDSNLDNCSFTNSILKEILQGCKTLEKTSKKIGLNEFNFGNYISICKGLLALANAPFDLRKHNVELAKIRLANSDSILNFSNILLKKLAAPAVDQIKYMTFSSQRMLDSFSMIHYRAFSLGRRVDLGIFNPECNILNCLEPADIEFKSFEGIMKAIKALENCYDRDTEGMQGFFYMMQASNVSASILDSETAEYIECALEDVSESFSDDFIYSDSVITARKWLIEMCHWHKISTQLKSVRLVLKQSLGQLEYYRKLQNDHGILFM